MSTKVDQNLSLIKQLDVLLESEKNSRAQWNDELQSWVSVQLQAVKKSQELETQAALERENHAIKQIEEGLKSVQNVANQTKIQAPQVAQMIQVAKTSVLALVNKEMTEQKAKQAEFQNVIRDLTSRLDSVQFSVCAEKSTQETET